MAENKGQQGTGRHPHKSTDEKRPHTKDEGKQHGRAHGSHGDDNRSHGGERDDGNQLHGRSHETQSHGRDHDREKEADLKRREYRGEDGQIHHHTRTYMEQHGGSHDNRDRDNRSHDREHAHTGSDNRSHGRDNNGSDRRR
ncbi:MAG: hypothetical protein AB7H90_11670 [Alphaproteobacteria bacterium]